jgi:hypothetical protein
MATYFGLTLAYSMRLKAAMIADVLTLACLYTIRIIAGAAAIAVPVSSWLLLFSVFFFLSLGYLKRYVELRSSAREPDELLSGAAIPAPTRKSSRSAGWPPAWSRSWSWSCLPRRWARPAPMPRRNCSGYCRLPLLYWLNRFG